MKIRVPKQIKIATHTYKVEFNPLIYYEESFQGSVNHLKQAIQVDPLIAPSRKVVTLLHEINHIINDVYRCKLDDDEIDKMSEGTAEFLCNNLGIEFDWSDIPTVED